jgi:hypothetical protein
MTVIEIVINAAYVDMMGESAKRTICFPLFLAVVEITGMSGTSVSTVQTYGTIKEEAFFFFMD